MQQSNLHQRRSFLTTLPIALVLVLSACNRQPTSGPVDIDWGHEPDARCRMMISDRHFATEIRDPTGKVWKFDDIGCALFWLSQQTFNEQQAKVEIWVADHRTGKWLNAQEAYYLHSQKSPMGYRFAATAEAGPEAVGYAEMKSNILARGK